MSLAKGVGWAASVGGGTRGPGVAGGHHFGGRWPRYRLARASLATDESAVTWGGFAAAWPGAGFIPRELRKRQLDRMALQMGPWIRYLRAAWREFSANPRARPLWSLSVEDLKQWRRLCLAMLAGQTPAWFQKYAVYSGEYVTSRPSLLGCKRLMTCSQLESVMNCCSTIASRSLLR